MSVTALWLPILVSTVAVFIASSIIHMGPFWHKTDFPRYPNEDRVLDALRPLGIPVGEYMMPRPASAAEMRSESFKEKLKRGPAVLITVFPPWTGSMTKSLSQWFVYVLVVNLLAGYVAGAALPLGTATGTAICRFVGTVAFIGYTVALWQMAIWYRRSVSITLKSTLDGLVYSAVACGIFMWLWPS
jgi:hypothetical protein